MKRIHFTVVAAGFLVLTASVEVPAQQSKYTNIVDGEAARQGLRLVPCPSETKGCVGSYVPKVINGNAAHEGMFPWVVSIGRSDADSFLGHQCGGTLISDRYVLTAAHCFLDTAQPDDFHLQMGTVILDGYKDKTPVRRILFEKNFNRSTNEGDIALLELSEPVTKSSTVDWIGIQDQQDFDNSGHQSAAQRIDYTLTGFGTIANGNMPVHLQYSDKIPSLTNAECGDLSIWGGVVFGNKLKDDMICAGNTNNPDGSDACKGDSGGSLALKTENGGYVAVGIVSRGALPDGSLDCTNQSLRVGVYTRVSAYASEIRECVKGDGACSFVAPGRQQVAMRN